MNLYGFVGNNGINYYDVLGLRKCTPAEVSDAKKSCADNGETYVGCKVVSLPIIPRICYADLASAICKKKKKTETCTLAKEAGNTCMYRCPSGRLMLYDRGPSGCPDVRNIPLP